jgi:hypothetical protein
VIYTFALSVPFQSSEIYVHDCRKKVSGVLFLYMIFSIYIIINKQTKDIHVKFEVFMAVTIKNAVFWDVTLWL